MHSVLSASWSGQPPACFHSCVGRIRYIGLVLYDADLIEETAKAPQDQLVQAQRNIIMDPFDPEVIASARRHGVRISKITAAQQSPVFQFVKKWGIALPLHPEFRTLPMLFYVPPLTRCSPRWRTAFTTISPRRPVWGH